MTEKQKSILNVTWKVGLGLIGLVILVAGVLAAKDRHEEKHGRNWDDSSLSGTVVVRSFNDELVRVWNSEKGRYTTPKLNWVSTSPERDSLTVFCDRKGKRGFLNVNTGKIVIPGQYIKAWQFSEGIAAVMGDNGMIGFINKENKVIHDFDIPFEKGFDYIFKGGYCTVTCWDEQESSYIHAVYDKAGKMVLPWGYTEVGEPNDAGYRVVENASGAWLYDSKFSLVFPDMYDNIRLAEGNKGVYLTRNHVKQLVDFSGKIIEPFVIDSTYPLKYVVEVDEDDCYSECELVPDIVGYRVGVWEGLMNNKTGKVITPAKYWSFEMISKDLIKAELGRNGSESVILDKRGNVVDQ